MKSLSLAVFEIFVKITFWPLDLGPRSKVMAPNESPYMVSYMSRIEMKSLSLAAFEIFEKIIFWPHDLRPKVMAPNEIPHMVSYTYTIEMKSLSLIVFKIFSKIAFWPHDLGPRSKAMAPRESPYVISCMAVIKWSFLFSLLVRYLIIYLFINFLRVAHSGLQSCSTMEPLTFIYAYA